MNLPCVCNIRLFALMLLCTQLPACSGGNNKAVTDQPVALLSPLANMSPEAMKVHDALLGIEKKELEQAGQTQCGAAIPGGTA